MYRRYSLKKTSEITLFRFKYIHLIFISQILKIKHMSTTKNLIY